MKNAARKSLLREICFSNPRKTQYWYPMAVLHGSDVFFAWVYEFLMKVNDRYGEDGKKTCDAYVVAVSGAILIRCSQEIVN